MITIVVEGKTYDLKRRMTTYEVRKAGELAAKFDGLDELIEQDEQKAHELITSTTADEETFIDGVIANCIGMEKEEVPKQLEFIHELLLYSELLKVSIPRKNLFSQSEKPTIGTMSVE